jgi:hypothetical protein
MVLEIEKEDWDMQPSSLLEETKKGRHSISLFQHYFQGLEIVIIPPEYLKTPEFFF